MPKLVDVNLEIFKKTAYKALGAMWLGIVLSTTLSFLFYESFLAVVLSSSLGAAIIVITSYVLLKSVKLKKTKAISADSSAVLRKGEKNE